MRQTFYDEIKNLKLDNLFAIVAHSNNIALIHKYMSKRQEKLFDTGIMSQGIEFHTNDNLPELEIDKDVWVRTNKCPDTKFITWVDVENPSSWAIYFGLVEHPRKMVFYKIDTPKFTVFRPRYELTHNDFRNIWKQND